MFKTYRLKPESINAIQWLPDKYKYDDFVIRATADMVSKIQELGFKQKEKDIYYVIHSIKGTSLLEYGDYIIKTTAGYYTVSGTLFERMYELQ